MSTALPSGSMSFTNSRSLRHMLVARPRKTGLVVRLKILKLRKVADADVLAERGTDRRAASRDDVLVTGLKDDRLSFIDDARARDLGAKRDRNNLARDLALQAPAANRGRSTS